MSDTARSNTRGRVLICDDNEDQYMRLREYLKREGFDCAERVETEDEVRDALDEAEQQRLWFQFVMLDIDLMGGPSRKTGIDIYHSLLSNYPNESYVIYSSRDVAEYRDEMNRLMYRDVALVLLDDLVERETINLALRRLIRQTDPRTVFVVHGRNVNKVNKFKRLLGEAFGLTVVTWEGARERANVQRKYIFEIVLQGIEMSHLTIVLFTDDERARMVASHVRAGDPEYEMKDKDFRTQSRPNVYIEAGYALGKRPNRTLFVEWPSSWRRFTAPSDFAGIDAVRFKDDEAGREKLKRRLEAARCVLQPSDNWKELKL